MKFRIFVKFRSKLQLTLPSESLIFFHFSLPCIYSKTRESRIICIRVSTNDPGIYITPWQMSLLCHRRGRRRCYCRRRRCRQRESKRRKAVAYAKRYDARYFGRAREEIRWRMMSVDTRHTDAASANAHRYNCAIYSFPTFRASSFCPFHLHVTNSRLIRHDDIPRDKRPYIPSSLMLR